MVTLALAECCPPLPRLPLEADLFGRLLHDHQQGHASAFFLRRDDNYLAREDSARFFRTWNALPAHQRHLLSHAAGRVLDVGAGAGQYALALQQRGIAVTALERSAGAVSVCRQRGLRDVRLQGGLAPGFPAERFDTILFLDHALGLAGTPDGLRRQLRALRARITPDGQMLAEFADYTATRDPAQVRYQQRNRAMGAYPGTLRVRLEYGGERGPDFAWLTIALEDFRTLCAETGWHIRRCIQVDAEATYVLCLGPA